MELRDTPEESDVLSLPERKYDFITVKSVPQKLLHYVYQFML